MNDNANDGSGLVEAETSPITLPVIKLCSVLHQANTPIHSVLWDAEEGQIVTAPAASNLIVSAEQTTKLIFLGISVSPEEGMPPSTGTVLLVTVEGARAVADSLIKLADKLDTENPLTGPNPRN